MFLQPHPLLAHQSFHQLEDTLSSLAFKKEGIFFYISSTYLLINQSLDLIGTTSRKALNNSDTFSNEAFPPMSPMRQTFPAVGPSPPEISMLYFSSNCFLNFWFILNWLIIH